MSYAAINAALVTRLGAVSGIGKVQGYYRWCPDGTNAEKFVALFLDSASPAHVNVWMVTRIGTAKDKKLDDDDTSVRRRHNIVLQGYYSLTDATNSEAVFHAIVEAIMENLRTGDRTLGGACLTYELPEGAAIAWEDWPRSGAVLCHSGRVTFQVEEILS